MTNEKVNFEVISIEKAIKPQHVVAKIKFKNSGDKEFTYVRKFYVKDFNGVVVIDGCHVHYNLATYEVVKIEYKYETKGYKKMNGGTTSNKIKNELEGKGIEIPKMIPQVTENGEVHHEKYDMIKTCLECGIPVYLAGPAGSGKNHTVEQIAKELGWNFYFSNSVQQEYKLTGFIDAGGCFHETEFYKA
jgi:hypothetical protein